MDDGRWQMAFLNRWPSRIGGGTDEIRRHTIGERLLGLPSAARTGKPSPFPELPPSPEGS